MSHTSREVSPNLAPSAPSSRSWGSASPQIVLCRPDAWVRVSFAATPFSILGWIYDAEHSLPAGMYVDVPHLDCLLVAALITVEGLNQVILKPKKFDRVVAVNVDEVKVEGALRKRVAQ
jgi:hypothetical protein